MPHSYNSPLLELRAQPGKGDFGIYTAAPVSAGALLLLFTGDIVDEAALAQVPDSHRRFSIQIEEGLYMVTLGEPEVSDYLNHSCQPTAGMSGQISGNDWMRPELQARYAGYFSPYLQRRMGRKDIRMVGGETPPLRQCHDAAVGGETPPLPHGITTHDQHIPIFPVPLASLPPGPAQGPP